MQKQLLIAGGGIGGLAGALAAARAGWQVRLYERTAAFSEVGAGVQLGPNVVRILHGWGLGQALQAVAALPQRIQVRCALSGHALAVLPLGATMQQRYGAPYVTIHRADLHGLLHAAACAHPDIALHLGQRLERFSDDGSAVTVTLTGDGSAGKPIEGDALLGADGLWSRTRAQLLGDMPPRVSGHLAYRALVPQQALADLPGFAGRDYAAQVTLWLGPRLHAVHYPVRRGELHNLVVIVEGPAPQDLESWDHAANAADLAAALHGSCSALQHLVHGVDAAGCGWRLWPLCDRSPLRGPHEMARGLVALLGDAAHPMRPYLAQGAGMAIEDAAELERALAMDALELPLRLRRYALNRWQRAARVQARAVRNGQIFHVRGPLRWARDGALRLLGAQLLDQPWLYGGGVGSVGALRGV
ncbi:MAG: FAD-dependent monooxygenase [Burkholderiaceae bacterium]|nr:FAD-dependent monooxygenase [Burkholderiaceae bacterium]